jgi:ribosomal-protein-alanine N-acetyltransferase
MLELNFSPFPNLQTERLFLRQVQLTDVNEVFRMRSNPETMKYIPRPIAKTKTDATKVIRMINRAIAKNEGINWAITYREQPELIGIIGYHRISKEGHRGEVGYMLDPAHHRKGIMQEALKAVLDYGIHELKFHTIEGVIDPGNEASEKLLQRNGFEKEAHFRENLFWDGKWLDAVHYTLFNK